MQYSTSLTRTEKCETGTGFCGNSGVLVNFYAPFSTMSLPIICLVKKEHVWDWGTKQAALEKAKNTGQTDKSSQTLIGGAAILIRCSVTPEGTGWTLRQKKKGVRAPEIWVPTMEGEQKSDRLRQNSTYCQCSQRFCSWNLLVKSKQPITVKTSLPTKGRTDHMSYRPASARGLRLLP